MWSGWSLTATAYRFPYLRVRSEIGQPVGMTTVLLVMAPWNDPIPVKRGWCLFEIASTLDMAAAGVKLIVKLPAAERAGLVAGVRKDANCILQCMADIQAEKAEAFSPEELEMIFQVIRKAAGGFAHVNQVVKKFLREWYLATLTGLQPTLILAAWTAPMGLCCTV